MPTGVEWKWLSFSRIVYFRNLHFSYPAAHHFIEFDFPRLFLGHLSF